MDLREFVSATLKQIIDGVKDAQSAVQNTGAINPKVWDAQRTEAAKMGILESSDGMAIHLVDFDVAVSVAEQKGTQGGIGLIVGPVVLGSKGQSDSGHASVNRIKFQVPISLPPHGKN